MRHTGALSTYSTMSQFHSRGAVSTDLINEAMTWYPLHPSCVEVEDYWMTALLLQDVEHVCVMAGFLKRDMQRELVDVGI